ncbi:MAG: hypothetical protein KQH57_17290 [Actinomycetales bacterium]|nr:hypothetical protein [Actinomycetales bacterium]
MTQHPTQAERSEHAESAQRVVVRHRGRDYPMTRAAYGRLLDRAAARVKGGTSTSLSTAERTLVAKAGWDEPPPERAHAPLATADELMARAGWTD